MLGRLLMLVVAIPPAPTRAVATVAFPAAVLTKVTVPLVGLGAPPEPLTVAVSVTAAPSAADPGGVSTVVVVEVTI